MLTKMTIISPTIFSLTKNSNAYKRLILYSGVYYKNGFPDYNCKYQIFFSPCAWQCLTILKMRCQRTGRPAIWRKRPQYFAHKAAANKRIGDTYNKSMYPGRMSRARISAKRIFASGRIISPPHICMILAYILFHVRWYPRAYSASFFVGVTSACGIVATNIPTYIETRDKRPREEKSTKFSARRRWRGY